MQIDLNPTDIAWLLTTQEILTHYVLKIRTEDRDYPARLNNIVNARLAAQSLDKILDAAEKEYPTWATKHLPGFDIPALGNAVPKNWAAYALVDAGWRVARDVWDDFRDSLPGMTALERTALVTREARTMNRNTIAVAFPGINGEPYHINLRFREDDLATVTRYASVFVANLITDPQSKKSYYAPYIPSLDSNPE